jgi:LytS/YehU family sensor histidine kinase
MVYVDPDKAGRSLIKMANIMRHTLNAAQVSYEPLQTTIDDLNDFVSLQRERFGDTVQVDYSVKIDRDDLVIAPLILTPFVENAFKYGIDPSHKSSIRITIYNDGADLCCVFVNTDFGYRPRPENSTGIGIANTRNRLDLVYPGKYVLDISAKDGLFLVKLAINLS